MLKNPGYLFSFGRLNKKRSAAGGGDGGGGASHSSGLRWRLKTKGKKRQLKFVVWFVDSVVFKDTFWESIRDESSFRGKPEYPNAKPCTYKFLIDVQHSRRRILPKIIYLIAAKRDRRFSSEDQPSSVKIITPLKKESNRDMSTVTYPEYCSKLTLKPSPGKSKTASSFCWAFGSTEEDPFPPSILVARRSTKRRQPQLRADISSGILVRHNNK
nr:hypothetical protein DM860_003472 [Ipomoea batatas]